jgi:hypothetical protein
MFRSSEGMGRKDPESQRAVRRTIYGFGESNTHTRRGAAFYAGADAGQGLTRRNGLLPSSKIPFLSFGTPSSGTMQRGKPNP